MCHTYGRGTCFLGLISDADADADDDLRAAQRDCIDGEIRNTFRSNEIQASSNRHAWACYQRGHKLLLSQIHRSKGIGSVITAYHF